MGMVLCKTLDQYLSSYQTGAKSMTGFGNNEVLNTFNAKLTFVDANAGGSTIALPECQAS